MPRLAIYLLGPPRVELDANELHIPRRKALALLAYLAVERHSHRRDSLAALLWPEYDQRSARTDLSRTLSVLSNLLGGEWFCADRESIGLNPERPPWLDVAVFRQRLALCEAHDHPLGQACSECQQRLSEAVEFHRDDFLAGFNLPDSLSFDEWARYQTASLRDELGRVLERLDEPATALSGGQQQRLCLARTLTLEPAVILLDEPTSGLDPISTAKVEDSLQELKQQYTVVIVPHSVQQAARVADYATFFLQGELVEHAPGKGFSPTPRTSARKTILPGVSVSSAPAFQLSSPLITPTTCILSPGSNL